MNDFSFSQNYTIYSPKTQGVYLLQESDWSRIKSMLEKINPDKKIFERLASLSFGIGISSVFSLISLYTVPNLPIWILPTTWAIAISSVCIGIILCIVDNQQPALKKISIDSILEEMQQIESNFEKEGTN